MKKADDFQGHFRIQNWHKNQKNFKFARSALLKVVDSLWSTKYAYGTDSVKRTETYYVTRTRKLPHVHYCHEKAIPIHGRQLIPALGPNVEIVQSSNLYNRKSISYGKVAKIAKTMFTAK